jgi:MHS family proline/betaine transporter-like MFS transporter
MLFISYNIHPLKILRFLSAIYIPTFIIAIALLELYISPTMVFIFQIITMCGCPNTLPAEPIIYKAFPVFKRFMAVSIVFAFASALMFVIASFGVELIVSYTNFIGLYIIIIPFSIFSLWGLNNFIKREKEKGTYVLLNKDVVT